jgi:hypothetical protein
MSALQFDPWTVLKRIRSEGGAPDPPNPEQPQQTPNSSKTIDPTSPPVSSSIEVARSSANSEAATAVGGAGGNDVTPETEGTNSLPEPPYASERATDTSAHSTNALPNVGEPEKLGGLGGLGGPHDSACENLTSGASDGAHKESKIAAVETEASPTAKNGDADGAEALRRARQDPMIRAIKLAWPNARMKFSPGVGALRIPSSSPSPEWPPLPGDQCSCCGGRRWWRERGAPRGWRCWTCHPPVGETPITVVQT